MPTTDTDALIAAAEAALRAPSIFNTQPWHWRVAGNALELSADPQRQLPVVDPDHRMTTLSCGIALHHARTALAAEGRTTEVDRLPDPARPGLLARIRVAGRQPVTPADIRRYESTLIRHTDRRLFTDRRVPAEAVDGLRRAAEGEGAHLFLVRPEDTPVLASAVSQAQATQLADPAYRAELARWTHPAEAGGSGVPIDTATPPTSRTVPVREFGIEGTGVLAPGEGHDETAVYAVLAGDGDSPRDWLRAGEALSAVLLTAVSEDLAVSPMSDVIEVAATRLRLGRMLSGIGYPFLVLRVGVAEPATRVPATPRRDPAEVIEVSS
ncbi:nitroreductase [Planosporangium thailandense]|uniref:Nitroreductase n=1 Tax=Planosporangium thailandense TaxID=765197 RepID=A0ABX0Y6U0_9ACTN|nr:nitroreductase [Planosporangium thailandense]NJC74053.1 nitroreductase [Planosporangium thailandense]